MHTGPMSDSEGDFSAAQRSTRPCPYCGSAEEHYYRLWESHDGAYEDEKHECRACGKRWWVEGIDS